MAIPKNSALTNANKTPGIYVEIQTGGAGVGDPNEQSTVLLLGEMLSSGSWAPGGVYDVTSEQDVIDGAGANAAGSACPTIRRQYRALVSQVGEGNVRVKAAPVLEPTGGVAAIYTLSVYIGDASLVVATNPLTSGSLRFQVAGEEFSVGYTTSDTNATIAALLRTELLKSKTLPVTIGALTTASFPLTYGHKGVLGEDLPLRAYYTLNSGVYLSLGKITYATAGSGSGTAKLTVGTQTCTATMTDAGAGAGVTAADFATNMKTALLTDDFPVIAGAVATATIPILLRDGRDVRRMAASIVTTTGTTARFFDLNGTGIGTITDGAGSASSFTYNGTLGTSLPTLTTALSNIDNAGSFGEWTFPWNTAGSSSTGLTAIATAIEAGANGDNQKNQHATFASVDSETAAAAIAATVTPVLGGSLRYTIGHCPDAGQQGYELAARRAGMFAAWITPATNSDAAFGGTPFQSRQGVPLNLPALRIRSTKATLNAAIVDGLEPWCVVNGQLAVLRGRNTSTSPEEVLWDPSDIRQRDMMRRRLRSDGTATFVQPKFKRDGIVNQSGEITIESVNGWAIGEITQFEREGFYDGAEQMKSGVRSEFDSALTRINLVVPASTVPMVHQFGVVLAKASPSTP